MVKVRHPEPAKSADRPGQNGMRVGSSIGTVDDDGTVTHRTIGRSLPIRISTLDNRVSPTRPSPQGGGIRTARQEMAEGVEERRSKRRPSCNGKDKASAMRGYPTRKGADFRHGLNGWEDVQHFDRWRR